LAAGIEKFSPVPNGGGGGVALPAAVPASVGGAPPAESKKEEKIVAKKESDDVRTLFSAFPLLPTSIICYIKLSSKHVDLRTIGCV
jgi:hypothetical protein